MTAQDEFRMYMEEEDEYLRNLSSEQHDGKFPLSSISNSQADEQ